MKLRNKKTGEIVELKDSTLLSYDYGIRFCKVQYDSLEQFCEYWEDYAEPEPLIKDEKIRKAIRVWAEANGIKEIIIFDSSNNAPYTPVGAVEFAGNASRLKVLFRTGERFDTNMIYTIEELCGEDKE